MPMNTPSPRYGWKEAKSLLPRMAECEKGPKGALVPDRAEEHDHIAVVYDADEAPPTITIKQVSGTVHTVLADGIAVAVVANTSGKAPTADDVLLVARSQH